MHDPIYQKKSGLINGLATTSTKVASSSHLAFSFLCKESRSTPLLIFIIDLGDSQTVDSAAENSN